MKYEITKEATNPEAFKQAVESGELVFKNEKEAKRAAKLYEKSYVEKEQEDAEIVKRFMDREEADYLATLSEEDRTVYLRRQASQQDEASIQVSLFCWSLMERNENKRRAEVVRQNQLRRELAEQLTLKVAE